MGKTTDSGLSKSEGGYKESVKKTLNNFPNNESILKHIFRNKDGHLPDTPENRKLILDVANNPKNYSGVDERGNTWYSEIRKDGSQVWVIVRDNNIRNAGINTTPQNWDSRTGFSKNIFKNTSWRVK